MRFKSFFYSPNVFINKNGKYSSNNNSPMQLKEAGFFDV